MNNNLSLKQKIQELEYTIPYHYIPETNKEGFSQTLFWSWGMHYLAGVELVISRLGRLSFSSIIDIGCGDGRFLREVTSVFSGINALGVDYSETAIALAKGLNPKIDYVCLDIANDQIPNTFDVATMVEVLEHIPPEEIEQFLCGVKKSLKPGGTLMLTVPHENKSVGAKHFQHFSSLSLRKTLSSHFKVECVVPFDRKSRLARWLSKGLGYQGSNYIITNKKMNMLLYKNVLHGCLREQPENRCRRLLAIAKKI